MIINFSKNFDKAYGRLPLKIKHKVDLSLVNFRRNPRDALLRNHALKGSMTGKRAISVTGDVRIVFEEYENYVLVIMLDVGTHNQVYG